MGKYTVCILGCGPRGDEQIHGFVSNPDCIDVVALCDKDEERLRTVAEKYGIRNRYGDADAMLSVHTPDIFCFTTLPDLRLPMVELGVAHHVKALAFEKPMALSLAEAQAIRDVCDAAGVKWVVSHQQKYGRHYQAVKEIVDAGRIGEVHTIHATSQAWLMQLGTHMIDYMIWLNGGVRGEWVIGQAHGKEHLEDSHRSPDYVFGQITFANGVRGIVEFGHLAPKHLSDELFWLDDTLTAYGTHGYARVTVGKGWEAVTKDSQGEILAGEGCFDPQFEQPLYVKDLADWLDDPNKVHPCNGDLSYHGFELAMALCLSSLRRGKVDIPLAEVPSEPLFDQLARII